MNEDSNECSVCPSDVTNDGNRICFDYCGLSINIRKEKLGFW